MMSPKTRLATVAFALIAATLMAGIASARTTAPTRSHTSPSTTTMTWGLEGWGGYNTMTMGDWNDAIDQSNASGANFDNINNGLSFGVGPTVTINGSWQLGMHFERLNAHTSQYQTTTITNEANVIGMSAAYMMPSRTRMAYGFGVTLDHYSLAGNVKDDISTEDTEGSGMGTQVMGIANYAFSPVFHGIMSAGYRIANINIDNIGGQPTTMTEDYSGLSLRVGISLNQAPSYR